MKQNLPQRKHPRLDTFDYSASGSYFVTICTYQRQCVLSRIGDLIEGTADAEAHCDIEYTECGKIAEEQLLLLEKRYPFLTVDKYVIMPNHIHAILILQGDSAAGASPRPTVMDIICTYKSLVTRLSKRFLTTEKLFQTSFYEHIVRSYDDYKEIAKYIYKNPVNWSIDELYVM